MFPQDNPSLAMMKVLARPCFQNDDCGKSELSYYYTSAL
jgi:hypothetical protein